MERKESEESQQVHLRAVIVIAWSLNIATTVIFFQGKQDELTCCGEKVHQRADTLAFGYSGLLIFQVVLMLIACCSYRRRGNKGDIPSEGPMEYGNINNTNDAEEDNKAKSRRPSKKIALIILLWLVCVNHFLGVIVVWFSWHRSRTIVFVLAACEVLAVKFWTIAAQQLPHGCILRFLRMALIPLVAFLLMASLLIPYWFADGHCQLVKGNEENAIWQNWPWEEAESSACDLCSDGLPPANGVCSGGDNAQEGTYCGTDLMFCFYEY